MIKLFVFQKVFTKNSHSFVIRRIDNWTFIANKNIIFIIQKLINKYNSKIQIFCSHSFEDNSQIFTFLQCKECLRLKCGSQCEYRVC